MSGYGGGGYGVGGYGIGQGPPFLEPVTYYQGLITSEYRGSVKALAWNRVFLQLLNDAATCLYTFSYQFDINNAVGEQLDVIGENVGASRTVTFQPSGGVSPVLDDSTYRILLLATIARNQWNGKQDSLYPIWQMLFPGGTIGIIDNQDMTLNVTLSGAFSSIIQDLITHDLIVPRPEGVLMRYNFAGLPMFGFDRYDSYISGFDDGGLWS